MEKKDRVFCMAHLSLAVYPILYKLWVHLRWLAGFSEPMYIMYLFLLEAIVAEFGDGFGL